MPDRLRLHSRPGSPRRHVATLVLAGLLTVSALSSALADEVIVTTFPGGYQEPGQAVVSTVIGAGVDDSTVEVTLPFEMPYFGALADRVSVCSNGWLAMGQTSETVSVNPALPSGAAPNGVIAPLWDDLTTSSGSVRTFTLGTAPNRVFVVDWSGVASFDGNATGLSFQVQLTEVTGAVVLAYGPGGSYGSLSYSAGIESPNGAVAFTAGGAGNTLSGKPSVDARFTQLPVTVAGRVLRDRPVADASGLGNSTLSDLPVGGARLVLVREDTGDVAGRATTAPDGSFALQTFGVESPVTFAVDLLAEGTAARVIGSSGAVYAHRVATGVDASPGTALGDVSIDASVDGVNAAFRRALNIQQALQRGFGVAIDAAAWAATNVAPQTSADTLATLDARWTPGAATSGGSSYTPAVGVSRAVLAVSDATGNPDPWDDDVLLRNYGQHVLASLSAHPGTLPSPRGFVVTTTEEAAWADGFGAWFAAVVKGSPDLVDTVDADSANVDGLEAPPASARGTVFPAAVAGSLWDLVDDANEPEDTFVGTIGSAPSTAVDVLATIDRALDALPDDRTGFRATDFFDAWRADGETSERVATARVFIHHGTLADDAAEPDDTSDEAALSPGVGVAFEDRRLSPFNDDVIRLEIPGPSPQRLMIGLTQSTTTGLDVELRNDAGVSLAFGSTVGADDPSRVLLDVLFTLQPGTYTVRVGWREGGTASYSVSLFSPLLVTTANLPEWTVGVPFKEDLTAAGGVAPITFTATTAAPGLSVVGGTRVTGIPSAAGDHVVSVRLLDAASPQNDVAADLPLRINPALGLPTLLALPGNRNVSYDLGTGGTGAEWTPVSAAPTPLGLLGGATLRLAGDTGSPRTFEVVAGAVDQVGAALDSGSDAARTRVVVTADLAASDGAAVPADSHLGYFFDALVGSRIDLRFAFQGSGRTPEIVALLDDSGVAVTLDADTVRAFGRKVKLRHVTAPRTSRYHVIFLRTDFVGTVDTKAKVRPPRRVRGQAAIDVSEQVAETTFDALAGSRVKIVLLRSPSPTNLRPTVTEIIGPNALPLPLPTERHRSRGRRTVLRLDVPADGRYTLRMSGDPGTTGPLQYRVIVDAPRRARLVLD